MFFALHFEFFFAFHQHYQLIGIVNEVAPNSAWWIDPEIARKSASRPTLFNFCLIDRRHGCIVTEGANNVKFHGCGIGIRQVRKATIDGSSGPTNQNSGGRVETGVVDLCRCYRHYGAKSRSPGMAGF